MTFPSVSDQVDFSTMPNGNAPIEGFVDPPAYLNWGSMLVMNGLAQVDSGTPNAPLGFAFQDRVVGPSYEVRVRLGSLLNPDGHFGAIGFANLAVTSGYLATWITDGLGTTFAITSLTGSTLASWTGEILIPGDWVGFQANNSRFNLYARYRNGAWQGIGSLGGLTLPSQGKVGFGAVGIL